MTKNAEQRAITYVARLTAAEAPARRIADLLAESLDPAEVVCSAFERSDKLWQVDLHYREKPDLAMLRNLVAVCADDTLAAQLIVEEVAPRDWIKESLIGLRPVVAGRFVIHGAHDRDRVPRHCIGIEIEAATAFGTGHHGTTRGCLLALDTLARRTRKPRRIIDIGTGTGVLAIAAAKIFRVPVLAVDIDPVSVEVARENARLNGVAQFVTVRHSVGMTSPAVIARAPYDLVLANILLRPLQRLAAPIARQLVPNATVVISGIMVEQANAALSAYRSQGLMLERAFRLDGWLAPMMVARSR